MDGDLNRQSSRGEEELSYLINSSHEIDVDDALEWGGPYGKFQILVQIFFMFEVFSVAYHAISVYFIGEDVPWRCVGNSSSTFCLENYGTQMDTRNINFTQRCKLKREEWTYSKPRTCSYIAEFDLVCKEDSIAALVGGVFFIGAGLAGIASNLLADMFGRKVILGTSLFITIASSVGCSFVKKVWQLILLRGLLGAGQGTCIGLSFVYLGEFIPTSKRSFSSNVFQVCFPISSFVLAAFGYLERNWRKLQLYLSFPSIIACFFLFLLPRSPRWLLATGKVAHAEEVVLAISKLNRRLVHNLKLKSGVSDINKKTKKYTYIDLFSNCKVLLLVLSLCFIWFTCALLFFGVTLEASNLGGNMYESFVLISLPDIPCCFISIYLCNRFGRKRTVLLSCLLAGIFIGAVAIFINNLSYGYVANIVLSITGKCFLNVAFNGIYLWTFELFPTVVRSQGFGTCLVVSRLGAAASPFLSNVLETVEPRLPFIVMGTMGVLSCLVGLILTETNKHPSREQYDDFFFHNSDIAVDERNLVEDHIRDVEYDIN